MKRAQCGFTIVEVLMFLAISTAMFTIAFFGTRRTQDAVMFRDSINMVESKINDVINNVDNGYFGNIGDYTCNVSGGTVHINGPNPGSGGGSSEDCVFSGKQITANNGASNLIIDTIVSSSDPTNSAEYRNYPRLRETYNIKNGVKVRVSNTVVFDVVRNRDGADQNDFRAVRNNYPGGVGGVNPAPITDTPSTYVKICLFMDNRTGLITVTNKDVIVTYEYSGAC